MELELKAVREQFLYHRLPLSFVRLTLSIRFSIQIVLFCSHPFRVRRLPAAHEAHS